MKTPTVPHNEASPDLYLVSTLKLLRTLSGIFGLLLHLWTCWISWEFEGLWWTVAYFFLFIYAELFWALKIHILHGLNTYSVLAGGWAILHILLVAVSLYYSRKT